MPFKKVANNQYVSPSGRTFTAGQVRAYYAKKRASGGKTRGRKRPGGTKLKMQGGRGGRAGI